MMVVVLCFRLNPVAGQDIHRFSQFFFNPSLLNPSLTGIDGQPAVFLSYRKQWMGIKGAPELSNFSFQAPGKNRIAIGLNASTESAGLLKSTGFRISSGYNLPVKDGNYFRFGMSVGAAWNRVDLAGLQFGSPDPDPVTGSLTRSNTGILASAGISYHTKSWHIGMSAPAMVEPDYITGEAFVKGKFKPLNQLVLHTSYRSYLTGSQNVIEYYVNYRLNKILPSQLELATTFHLGGKGWVGASWRQGPGFSGLAGFNLSKTFAVGYAYTMKGADGNIAFPSHEIQLGILFGQRFKGVPSFSFINSEKESKGNRKPGMVASANRKPGYVPLQKGAVIAKGPSAKPLPPKTGGQPTGKPAVASGGPAKQPAPEKPPVVKPASEKPVVESPAVAVKPQQQTKPPEPVAKPEPAIASPGPAKPSISAQPIQPKNEPAREEQPVTVAKPEPAPLPAKPAVAETPAQPKKDPVADQQKSTTAEPVVSQSKPAEPVAPAKLPVIADQQKQTPLPTKPIEVPATTPVPDKTQGRPRLTQPTGAFDDLLPGETPQKPEPKPAPEEEEGEDVAGLHGTRHVQDS
ncbi:MAG: PorP/SprF family type IX secretion system membrane protein, partial [Bacteroidota bacterium]